MKIRVDPQARNILWRQMERYVERLLSYPPETKRIGTASLDEMVLNLLEKSQKLGDHVSHLRLLEHFAETLQHSNNLDILDRHLTTALAQSEMPNAQRVKLASLHIRLLTQRGELERAENVLERAWTVADTQLLQAELYNRKGILLEIKAEFPGSYEAYMQGLQHAQEYGDHGDLHLVASIYNNLGNWAFVQYRYEEALSYYQKSLERAELLDDPSRCAPAEGGLAMTLGILKEDEAAKPYHEAARKHYEQANHRLGMIRVDLNRCYFALVQSKYDEAKQLANRARIEAYQLGDLQREATAQHHLGKIFFQEGDYAAAFEHLAAALDKRQLLGMPLYEEATRDLIKQLAERIECDCKIERTLQRQLYQQCQEMLKPTRPAVNGRG